MFRKPIRLEKWIAFDGAFGVEAIEASQDTVKSGDDDGFKANFANASDDEAHSPLSGGDDASDDAQTLFPFDIGFAPPASATNSIVVDIGGGSGENRVELDLPVGIDIPPGHDDKALFAYRDSSELRFALYGYTHGREIYFEFTKPENGELTFCSRGNINSLVDGLNIAAGEHVVMMETVGENINLYYAKLINTNPRFDFTRQGGIIAVGKITNSGAVRFSLIDDGNAEQNVERILRSLVFIPDDDDHASAGKFSVHLYHHPHSGSQYDFDQFTDQWVYTGSPSGGLSDASVPGGGGVPEPEQPSPGDGGGDPPPVDGGGDGESDIGHGGGNGGDDGESGASDPTGEAEAPVPDLVSNPVHPPAPDGVETGTDSGGAGQGGDAGQALPAPDGGMATDGASGATYVHYEEYRDPYLDDDAADGGDRAEPPISAVPLAENAAESPQAAAALELSHDFETAFTAIRADRNSLQAALSRLQEEYLARSVDDRAMFRENLKALFDSGNRELDAVNLILAHMHRELNGIRRIPADRLDGMLQESLRELMVSAARRSGETTALAEALNGVADILAAARRDNSVVDGETLDAAFARIHSISLGGWLERASRADAMGRDLARSNRGLTF